MRSTLITPLLMALLGACTATLTTEGSGGPAAATAPAASAPTVTVPAAPAAPATEAAVPARATSGEVGTVDGAKQRLMELTQPGVDFVKAVQSLKPAPEDLEAIFGQSVLAAIQNHVDNMYAKLGEGQPIKEVYRVDCVWSDEIRSWTREARDKMPGGYQRLAPSIKPGLTFCRFKATGGSYDSLVFVRNHWVLVPKPFRAVKAKAGQEKGD